MVSIITHAKQIQKKSHIYKVRQVGPNWFKVSGGSGRGEYDVNLGVNGGTCTCTWGRYRPTHDHRSGCSHVIAAMNYRARLQGQRISVWASDTDARRQHRPMLKIGDGVIITTSRSS